MALRRKVLLVVGASLAGLIVVLYLISRTLLLNSYLNLEEQDVRRNVQRALNNLQNETDALSSTTADWAYWDETYAFAQTGDQEFIDSNVNDATFTSISLNLMVVVDKQGRMLLGKGYDLVNGAETALPTGIDPYISAGSSLLTRRDDDHFTGLVLVGDVPMLLASRAVLTTDKKGPSMGTLIFGRILDEASVAEMAQATQLTLAIQRINDPALPADFQAASTPLSQSETVVVQPADNDLVNGYTILRDLNGSPALFLRVQLPRDIYAQGQTSLSTLILGVLLVGLVMIIVTLVLIERLMLAPLLYLSHEVKTVTASADPSARVNVKGDDELASLSTEINKMLYAIEQAQAMVRRNEEHLQKSLDELKRSQTELVDNDYQLQLTVSRLEKQKRQLQRMYEFMRTTVGQMENSLLRGAARDELMQYLKNVQAQFNELDLEKEDRR